MVLLLRLIPVYAFLFALTLVGSAQAQETTITLDELTGVDFLREEERQSSEYPLRISRKDCFDSAPERYEYIDDPDVPKGEDPPEGVTLREDYTWLRFIPTVQGVTSSHALEVWVSEGVDCSKSENRDSTSNSCSLIYSRVGSPKNPEIYLNPRDIIDRAGDKEYGPKVLSELICSKDENLIDVPISLYIIVRQGSTVPAYVEWTDSPLDLNAPPPPDDLEADPGDEHIFLEWAIESDLEDPETEGFTFYCVPAGTESSMGGAGMVDLPVGDGGAGGATAECTQTVLIADRHATAEAIQYECGEVLGRGARRGQTDEVDNGVTYAVAVAAKDVVGNSGKLSLIKCVEPKPVTTFFEGYTGAGGKGGGGFCQAGGKGGQTLWWLGLMAALLLYARRRGGHA